MFRLKLNDFYSTLDSFISCFVWKITNILYHQSILSVLKIKYYLFYLQWVLHHLPIMSFGVEPMIKGLNTYEIIPESCHFVFRWYLNTLAHPISWYWLVGFFLWMVHNVLVLNRKVNIDKERQISSRFNAISRLYPKGTFIPHKQ